NPTYIRNRTAHPPPPSVAAGTGIYSEVIVDSNGETVTKITAASDGQVFTGMYNVVAPLTPPVKSASEMIQSAAYACIQINSDETPATPGGLDHTRDGEVTRDKIYGEGLETNTVKSASEIIQSAAYACIQVNSDEPPATQGGLDHTRDGEVTRDKIYSEGLETNTTKLTASDGQVFTGMYNVVAPLTPP
ncbi:hypothetical protein GBAR_LOCUS590, partial [Geodia barretti]